MPRAQCQFYTAKSTRCTRGCDAGVDYCRTHIPKAEALGARPAEGHCLCVRRVHGEEQWCGQPHRAGETVCEWHWQRMTWRIEEQERERQRALFEEATLQAYLNQDPQQQWPAVARHLRMRARTAANDPIHLTIQNAYNIARRYFLRTTPQDMPVLVFNNFWQILWEQEQGIWVAEAENLVPPPAAPLPPMGQMGRLAADTQNVHTAAVSKQTNSNVELLLEHSDDPSYDVLVTLTTWWMGLAPQPAFADYWKVMEDVKFWYEKRTC